MANWNPFAGLLSAADPNMQNEAYGVPESDVRMAQAGLLGNLGATLLAAGQRISPAQRAQLLGQLGPQMGQFSTDIYNAAQRRYQQGMLAEAQAKRKAEEEQRGVEEKRQEQLRENQAAFGAMFQPTYVSETEGGEMKEIPSAYGLEQILAQFLRAYPKEAAPMVAEMFKPPSATKTELPSDWRLYQLDMADRKQRGVPEISFGEWDVSRRRAATPTALPPGFTQAVEAVGKGVGEVAASLPARRDVADQYEAILNYYDQYKDQIESSGKQIGLSSYLQTKLADVMPQAREFFGIPEGAVFSLGAVESGTNRSITQMLAAKEFPTANFSNKDLDFVKSIRGNPTQYSFRTKIEVLRAAAQRNVEISEFVNEKLAEGVGPADINKMIAQEFGKRPILNEDLRNRISEEGKGKGAAIATPAGEGRNVNDYIGQAQGQPPR
jgi:hypothetical protein